MIFIRDIIPRRKSTKHVFSDDTEVYDTEVLFIELNFRKVRWLLSLY